MLTCTLPVTLTADLGKRRLRGQAVPWNVEATVSTGQRVRFAPGSVDLSDVPLVLHHDDTRPFGKVIDAASDDAGHTVVASVSEVPDGDTALVLAADGVVTGFSVGVEPTEYQIEGDGDAAVMVITASEAMHLALVTVPAFADARVAEVAAAAAQPKEEAVEQTTLTAEAPEVVAAAPRHVAATAHRVPTVGEYLYAAVRRQHDVLADMRAVALRAAGPEHITVSDVPGLIPAPIYGPVVEGLARFRPFLTAFGPMAGPEGGKTFSRPKITEHLADAATATEKTDVTGNLHVDGVDVTYAYIKRAANISAEAIAFTSPGVLDLTARDLLRAYVRGSEKAVVTSFLAGTYNTAVSIAADGADAETVLAKAAAAMYSDDAVGTMPDTLLVSPDVWAKFAGFLDGDKRPRFPMLNPVNSSGSNSGGVRSFDMNVLGLRMVVSWALGTGKAFLVASDFVETYEAHRVSMRADEPTVLGVALGTGGAVAQVVTETKAVTPLTIAAP